MTAAVLAAVACGPRPATAQELVRNLELAASPQPFSSDDLLWMEVRAGETQLAESMNVYSSRAGVFVPLGEFSRVLELAVGVFPAQRRAEGWVLSQDRKLVVDLASGKATLAGREIAFGPDQVAIYNDDLYIRLDLAQQLLPVKLSADTGAQVLTVVPTEPLPYQARQARDLRRAVLANEPAPEAAVRLKDDYRLFSPPGFDVNIGGQLTRDGVDQSGRYDVRVAGDLFWSTFEGYVGSNDDGEVSDVRVLFTRKDPDGRALGPLGGTRASAGDVFTPSMAIGASSFAGRGVFYSSAPLESLDLATPLNLRGELALGEEVELYVNEILQATQTSAVQGRYEFLDVPLAFGLNTIRLVFYGSQGQTREVVRRINFGSGQVEAGKLSLRIGMVEQNKTVFDIGDPTPGLESGALRTVIVADYGLTPELTLSAGAAHFKPSGLEERTVGSLGVRGSLGPAAVQVDAAFDDQGGQGLTLGVAGRPFKVSVVARHSEYQGGFIDETRQLGVTGLAPLRRVTDLRADGQINLTKGMALPVSASVRRLEREDATRVVNGELRGSAPVGRFYASTAVVYEEDTALPEGQRRRWTGSTDLSTLVAKKLQLRGGLAYEFSPNGRLQSAYATADWQVSEISTLRLGIIRTLDEPSETSIQASSLWSAKRFDLAFNASYETEAGQWRMGVQLGFGFGYDPARQGYRMTRPGVASGGSVAVNAWVDENGDGVRSPGEPGTADLVADTSAGGITTDKSGRAFTTGLGDGASTRLRLNAEAVDDPFLVAGPSVIEIVPRPGRTTVVDYPMRRSAEVEMTAQLFRAEGDARPLAALNVELVGQNGGKVFTARSDHAGILFFEGVPPGTYEVRLDEKQAATLGVSLVRPVTLVVPTAGGFVRGEPVRVRIPEAQS